jgi:hypothetical protein
MHFLKPSFETLLQPLLLVALALVPGLLILRLTAYAILATPLQPLIESFGSVYRDKPIFLTYRAVHSAVVWAAILYLALATFGICVDAPRTQMVQPLNPAVNADAPPAALLAGRASQVTLVR